MELTINITDKKAYDALLKFLRLIGIKVIAKRTEKKAELEPITKLAEKSLAEEWDSKEDERWDNVL